LGLGNWVTPPRILVSNKMSPCCLKRNFPAIGHLMETGFLATQSQVRTSNSGLNWVITNKDVIFPLLVWVEHGPGAYGSKLVRDHGLSLPVADYILVARYKVKADVVFLAKNKWPSKISSIYSDINCPTIHLLRVEPSQSVCLFALGIQRFPV